MTNRAMTNRAGREAIKLASLKEGGRDGTLVVVSADLQRCARVPGIAATMQAALESWATASGKLAQAYTQLNAGRLAGAEPFAPENAASPLPRAYQFIDGSAYVHHAQRVHQSRGLTMPDFYWTEPLMYQCGSDGFMGPTDPMLAADESWGLDFEAEVAVITDAVPMGVSAEAALDHIALVMLLNDFSLRNLIVAEKAKGVGFLNCKPTSSFTPVAATPAVLGAAWDGRKLHRPLVTSLNGKLFGRPECGEDMTFDFGVLVAHAAKTRALGPGTIIGSGPVSNHDHSRGCSAIAEQRLFEKIEHGKPTTPFMRFGDRVRVEMFDADGRSIFGAIDQPAASYEGP